MGCDRSSRRAVAGRLKPNRLMPPIATYPEPPNSNAPARTMAKGPRLPRRGPRCAGGRLRQGPRPPARSQGGRQLHSGPAGPDRTPTDLDPAPDPHGPLGVLDDLMVRRRVIGRTIDRRPSRPNSLTIQLLAMSVSGLPCEGADQPEANVSGPPAGTGATGLGRDQGRSTSEK